MIEEKQLKQTLVFSGCISLIFVTIYYFVIYVPMTKNTGSLLGYPKIVELIFVYMILYVLSLPLTYGLFILKDYYLDTIYPKKWLSVTLLEKRKIYNRSVSLHNGMDKSGYVYWFDFQNDEGDIFSFKGTTYEYEILIEGATVKILVKGPIIIDLKLID